jgi:hypothetical protein
MISAALSITTSSLVRNSAIIVASALLGACGGSVTPRTGFIPPAVELAKLDGLTSEWRVMGFDASDYGEIIVYPVKMPNTDDYGDLDAEKIEEVRSIFDRKLREAVGSQRGTGTKPLVIQAAVTKIKPNRPILNVAPQSQIMKRGYGFASCEIFASVGEGGPVVAAYMQTTDTSRFSTEKLSATGTAERGCGEWADAFVALLRR